MLLDTQAQWVDRMDRALLSLEGLSCGDAFGEQFFFMSFLEAKASVRDRNLPNGPWQFTDDTMMAISIFETLRQYGEIREDLLAAHFASLYDPSRGYGAAMHELLLRLLEQGGQSWEQEAGSLFDGRGSFGNGSAMRVAPLGAYFSDDLEKVAEQARRSAITTHSHSEATAGAIAVAVGAALAWRAHGKPRVPGRTEFLESILPLVPDSEVRKGIEAALRLPADMTAERAGFQLGNGSKVTAMDTVPFVLWSAGSYLDDFEEAMWQTVSARGDKDTTCAIVGGIVALRAGLTGIPKEWLRRRESFGPLLQTHCSKPDPL